ncbi:MAG: hypothetical protein ACYCWW_01255 [Deltaproteobacteria bacterium]
MPLDRSLPALTLLAFGGCLSPALHPVELVQPGQVAAVVGANVPSYEDGSALVAVGVLPHLQLEAEGAGNWLSDDAPDWRLGARLRGEIPLSNGFAVNLAGGVAESYYTVRTTGCFGSCDSDLRSRELTLETGVTYHAAPIGVGLWLDHAGALSQGASRQATSPPGPGAPAGATCVTTPIAGWNYLFGVTLGIEADLTSFAHFLFNFSTGLPLQGYNQSTGQTTFGTNLENATTALQWFTAGLGFELVFGFCGESFFGRLNRAQLEAAQLEARDVEAG